MILDEFRLDGRVALVTGASQGLGQAMALALAEAGADIAGLDRCHCDETGNSVGDLGHRFAQTCVDLRRATPSELSNVIDWVQGELGRIDILVNNAGIIRRAPALEFSEEDWDDVMQIDLKALFFLSQAAARAMVRQGGGKIINVASMLSFQGGIRVPSYAAAKSGVAALTRSLANEWAEKGINVNAIAPGYMATANTEALRGDTERSRAILERIPAGRWGTPEDLRGLVVLLASPAANYMHGAVIPVDGGWLAR
jgi:2-dehydro-3-deoxy-D-gluconate 5-dehydrogenase